MALMTWTVPTPDPADGPLTGAERPLLTGYLGWQRTTLLSVCAGLTGEQLALRPLPSSDLSLLGLVRHMAKVERIWLRQRIAGESVEPLHGGAGDPADFRDGVPADAAQEVARLQAEWSAADLAVADVPLEHEIEVHGQMMSLRLVYLHLVHEYARHNGHADLLREAIDGVTGR